MTVQCKPIQLLFKIKTSKTLRNSRHKRNNVLRVIITVVFLKPQNWLFYFVSALDLYI